MQTSFMHPPFGFALFYLRSVAPAKGFSTGTGRKTAPVTTGQIYWGAVPFVLIRSYGRPDHLSGIVSGGLEERPTSKYPDRDPADVSTLILDVRQQQRRAG